MRSQAPEFQKVNTTQESQLLPSGASETMASPIGVRCEAEGSGEGKEVGKRKVGKYLAIQIWSPNTARISLTASFRGRPLIGGEFEGAVLSLVSEGRQPLGPEAPRSLRVGRDSGPLIWWGWDQRPGSDTPLHAAKQWLSIAQALHEPIEMED